MELDDFEAKFDINVKNLETKISKKYPNIGSGRNRTCFQVSPYSILKIPRNLDGGSDNLREPIVFKKEKDIFARCRLVVIDNIECVLMEHLDIDFPENYPFPDWVYSIDCAQVGLDRHGNLKAYDYA